MRNWDLTSGLAKLDLAMDNLLAASHEAEQYWNDDARRKFQGTYIEPLEPRVRGVIDAVRRLAEVLANAERQCGIDSNLL
jgi:hypothetical protein